MTTHVALDVERAEMLKAAALGQAEWGTSANAVEDRRYAIQNRRLRRRCECGCGKPGNWIGCANGLAMMSGCEWLVRQWVRDPNTSRRLRRATA